MLDIKTIVGKQFTDMCKALGLWQHFTSPTYISHHILDLLITEYGTLFGIDRIIHDTYFLDNSALIIETKMTRITMTECTTKLRIWKKNATLEFGERFDQLN